MCRGMLTQDAINLSTAIFGREVYIREMRLIPYVRNCLVNGGTISMGSVDDDEKMFLDEWEEKGLIKISGNKISCSEEFWNITNLMMWSTYVNYEKE